MTKNNSQNLKFFESRSMHSLYESMHAWQEENQKRLLSLSVHKDEDKFCCIALTNPSEVIITGPDHTGTLRQAHVTQFGHLHVKS